MGLQPCRKAPTPLGRATGRERSQREKERAAETVILTPPGVGDTIRHFSFPSPDRRETWGFGLSLKSPGFREVVGAVAAVNFGQKCEESYVLQQQR